MSYKKPERYNPPFKTDDWIVPWYSPDGSSVKFTALSLFETMTKLWIFDADGTLRHCTVPGQPCPNKPGEYRIDPHMIKLFEHMKTISHLAIASNQAGVGLGYLKLEDAYQMLQDTGKQIIDAASIKNPLIKDEDFLIYMSPSADSNHPDRKPNPGMLNRCMKEVSGGDPGSISPGMDVVMVGDMESDRDAASNAGCRFVWAQELIWLCPEYRKAVEKDRQSLQRVLGDSWRVTPA